MSSRTPQRSNDLPTSAGKPLFWIRPGVTGISHSLAISGERFGALRHARVILADLLAIEQKYEVLVQNYLDFEREILNRLAHELVRDPMEYLDFYENILAFDVRLVNFLAAARLYAEQTPRHAETCVGLTGFEAVEALKSVEYDANPSYRFMEQLRNHVLHAGLPVHGAGISGGWKNIDNQRYLEHTVALVCRKETLAANKKFKKKVLNELADSTDLATALRSYMSSLSNIHIGVRKLLHEAGESARKTITDGVSDFAVAVTSSVDDWNDAGLRAEREEAGEITESFLLMLRWDDVRLRLVARNRKLTNLPRRHVSGRSHDKDALKAQREAQ